MIAKLTLDNFLPYRLSVASNAVSSQIANAYRRRFGLKVAEWRLIAILAETDALTPQSLGDQTRMDKIAVSRAAATLIDRALLAVRDNPNDGRSHFLSLTDNGRALYDEIAPLALVMETAIFRNFSPEEMSMLDTMLRRIENDAL